MYTLSPQRDLQDRRTSRRSFGVSLYGVSMKNLVQSTQLDGDTQAKDLSPRRKAFQIETEVILYPRKRKPVWNRYRDL